MKAEPAKLTTSVLMSVYAADSPDKFLKAFCSITVNQTTSPDQVVLVVDGPVSLELQNAIDQAVVRWDKTKLVRLEKNLGLGLALNRGLMECSADIIVRMDSDDVSRNIRIQTLLYAFKFGADLDLVGSYIKEVYAKRQMIRRVPLEDSRIRTNSILQSPFNHVSVAFRRDTIVSLGGYRDLKLFEDYDLWLRLLAAKARVKNLDIVLVDVSMEEGALDRRRGWGYLKKEFTAIMLWSREGLIPKYAVLLRLAIALVVRLAPKPIFSTVYFAIRLFR